MASLKDMATHDVAQQVLWGVAFVGVCGLVALGKVKPETVEYMLFALVGRAAYVKGSQLGSPQLESKNENDSG